MSDFISRLIEPINLWTRMHVLELTIASLVVSGIGLLLIVGMTAVAIVMELRS